MLPKHSYDNAAFEVLHTYVIGHYNLSVRIIDLVSPMLFVLLFMVILFTLRVFAGNLLRGNLRRNNFGILF